MIIYVENPKESTKKLELIRYKATGYKVIVSKSVIFLYPINELLDNV